MHRAKHRHFRNRLDMADHVQVRVIKRRLRLSESELNKLVDRVGNSIAAISKEVALKKAVQLNPPRNDLPPAEVISAEMESCEERDSFPHGPAV